MEWTWYNLEDRLFLLVLAGYLALLTGGPRWLHTLLLYDLPARGWRRIVIGLEGRLNRQHRPVRDRRMRGRLVVLVLTGIALLVAACISLATALTGWGWYVELAALTYLLPLRVAALPALDIHRAIRHKRLQEVETLLQPHTDADLEVADGHMQLRLTVAYVARCFPRYIIAPACWYLLLGLPGLMLCRLFSLLVDLWPMSHMRYRAFASVAHFWDRLVQAVPVRLALLMQWPALLFVPKARLSGGTQALSRKPGEPPVTTRTLPLRLVAYGLGLSLGGSYIADGRKRPEPWIGDGRARLENTDLSRALIWYACCVGLWLVFITGVYLLYSR